MTDEWRKALEALTTESSMVKELRKIDETYRSLMEAIKPSSALRDQLEAIRRLNQPMSSLFEGSAAAELFRRTVEEDQRFREAFESLTGVHTRVFAQETLADLTGQAVNAGSAFAKLSNGFEDAVESIRIRNEAFSSVFSHLTRSLADSEFAKLNQLAKPFIDRNIGWNLLSAVHGGSEAARLANELLGGFRVPVIDAASALSIAKSWGAEGVKRQLLALAIDADALPPTDANFGPPESSSSEAARRRRLPDTWTLIGIILSILLYYVQERSSAEMEARMTAEVRTSTEVEERHFQALSELLAKVMERDLRAAHERFVVRERVATIRAEPRHGSGVFAQIFPNQVVTPVAERGKWIQVEYYDWLAQEQRIGWTLKKYFTRVASGDRQEPGGNAR